MLERLDNRQRRVAEWNSQERGRNNFPISRRALAPVCVIRTGASALRLIAACFTSSGSYCDLVPQFAESAKLEAAIKANLEGLGYGE